MTTSKSKSDLIQESINKIDLSNDKKIQPLRWISVKGQAGVPKEHRLKIEDFNIPDNNIKEIWYYKKLASDRIKYVPKKQRYEGKWIGI